MIRIFTYSKHPNCPPCIKAKKYFHELKLDYEEIDVHLNKKEYIMLSGKKSQITVPLIEIGTDVISGFSKQKIDEALINNNISRRNDVR